MEIKCETNGIVIDGKDFPRCKSCKNIALKPAVSYKKNFCSLFPGEEGSPFKCKEIDEDFCSKCDKYENELQKFNVNANLIYNECLADRYRIDVFKVRVRPCGEEYNGKTFFGIHLGQFPCANYIRSNKEKTTDVSVLSVTQMMNPFIYIPELGKCVWGYESWWSEINSGEEENIKEVSDKEIENTITAIFGAFHTIE